MLVNVTLHTRTDNNVDVTRRVMEGLQEQEVEEDEGQAYRYEYSSAREWARRREERRGGSCVRVAAALAVFL